MSFPRYPSINLYALRTIAARLIGRKRSLVADSQHLCRLVDPPIHYLGLQNLDLARPYVITVNHYSRPGFSTAWIALGISALLPDEPVWIMSNQWLFEDNPLRFILRPLMRFVLRCITLTYGFVPMPTMVKGYSTSQERFSGVLRAVETIRSTPGCILGITPEGMDSPDGALMQPPSGVGRFLLYLQKSGLELLPAAVFERDGRLNIRFGEPYSITLPTGLSNAEVDLAASRLAMQNIGELMGVIFP